MLSSHDKLAIAELAFYGTALPASLFLWVKEGWKRLEWLFVFTLASLRIVGSILQLMQDESGPPSSVTSIAIVNGIGLSPLFGITLMLVHRLCKTAQHERLAKIAVLLHVAMLGAIPLLIVGILKLFNKKGDGKTLGRILAAIGLAIFLQVYFAQVYLSIYLWKSSAILKKKPFSYLLKAVFIMSVLLFLRLLYSFLSFFVTSTKVFNPVTGDLAAQVLLSIVPENLVVLVAVGWGIFNRKMVSKSPTNGGYELSRTTT